MKILCGKYFITFLILNKKLMFAYRVSQKKCDLQRLLQNFTFLWNSFVKKIFKKLFFWYFNDPKKSANLFFSQNQKFRKTKMCKNIVSIEI